MSQARAERVAAGSRRQRDLAAAGVASVNPNHHPDAAAFATRFFPDEDHYAVTAVRFRLQKSGQSPTPTAVREGLRQRGWLKEQRS